MGDLLRAGQSEDVSVVVVVVVVGAPPYQLCLPDCAC